MNRVKPMLLSICLMMVACNANDSISRENRCQFMFDTTLHLLPCHLTGIIGNNGHFCQVQTYVDKIVTYPFHLEITLDVGFGVTNDLKETITIKRGELYALFESKTKED